MLCFKLVQCGDSNAGKTTFAQRVAGKAFVHEVQPTIGVDVQSFRRTVNGQKITLQYWDTAGQERHFSLTNNFFRGTHFCLIFVDLSSCSRSEWRQRLLRLKEWNGRLKESVRGPGCEVRYVGTKRDSSRLLAKLDSTDSFPILKEEKKPFDRSLYREEDVVDAEGVYAILQYTKHLVLTSSKKDSQHQFDRFIFSLLFTKMQNYTKRTPPRTKVSLDLVPPSSQKQNSCC